MTTQLQRTLAAAFVCVLTACSTTRGSYSGTVQTEYSSVGSQIGGRVVEVDATAGERVRRGDVIVRLDPSILQAELEEAIDQAAASRDAYDQARNGPVKYDIERAYGASRAAAAAYQESVNEAAARKDAARAALAGAQADEHLAYLTYQRTRKLAMTGDLSEQTYDQALSSYQQAQSRTEQARAQYEQLVRADLPGESQNALGNAVYAQAGYQTLAKGTRPEEIAQAQAQAENADAAVARARARLDEAVVRAPVDGVIASMNLHVGDILGENQTAAVIDTFSDPYAYIYVSQHDLRSIQTAPRLVVHSDAGDGVFSARVESFDRTAQFTPENVETAAQRADLVYGVKIRILDPRHALLDGTTVTVGVP